MFDKYINKKYCIDGFNINLGKNHMLPKFQKQFCMYDRIIPFLAEISGGGVIIDIGANVGDTLAGMINKTDSRFLCIEPNDDFYKILCENIQNFTPEIASRIITKKVFISQKLDENYVMDKQSGTARKILVNHNTDTESVTLKKCIEDTGIMYKDIKLIKVDTDGYDYECIMSMEDKLKDVSPIIYWENALEVDLSFEGYRKLNDYLAENNYNNIFVFDNFGNYISHGDNSFLKNINEYLNRIRKLNTGKTFHYVDVIACKIDKVEIVKKMIEKYNNSLY